MVDWYEKFRDTYDDGLSEASLGNISTKFFAPDVPGERLEMGPDTDPKTGTTLIKFRARWLLVPIILWLLAYISAAFPYIGTYAYNKGHGEITYALQTPSPRVMPLFKGQVAFIDYKLDSNPNKESRVYLDIKPWPGFAPSKNRLVITGKTEGRLAVPITETDLYQFTFSSASSTKNAEIYYSATWGAR